MPALSNIVGHEKIKERLHNALVSGQVSHAYLFGGPSGVGKKTIGLAFARALLCKKGNGDICNNCDDCMRTERGVHPDLHLISPEGASIKIHQLRSIQDSAFFTSFSGGRQVYIVEQAEKMTLTAANGFLKILEEPPNGVTFILITNDPASILPTIHSRCQRYSFFPLTEEQVIQVVAQEESDNERLHVAVKLSGGSPGRALLMLNDMDRRYKTLELIMRLARQRPLSAFIPLEDLSERSDLEDFIESVIVFFRDVMIYKKTKTDDLLINIDWQENIAEIAKTYAETEVLDILITAEKASRQLAGNANRRLLLDTLIFKIAGMRDDDRG